MSQFVFNGSSVCGALMCVALLGVASTSHADVYGYFEPDGSIQFTDKPITGRKADKIILLPKSAAVSNQTSAKLNQLRSGEVKHDIGTAAPLNGRLPIRGRITSLPGKRRDPFDGTLRWHSGVDIAAPIGTSVLTVAPGTVAFSGNHAGYGKMVVIDHGNGVSIYAHLDRSAVREGDTIAPEQTIAYSGNTGRSTGPHLHFEAWEEGRNVTQRFIDATPLADRNGSKVNTPPEPIRFVRQSDGSILLTNQPVSQRAVRYQRQADGSTLLSY